MSVAHIEAGPPGREVWDALKARPTIALPFVALTTSAKLATGPCILIGWSVIDGSLGAGSFNVYDGLDTAGPLVAADSWAAAGSGEGPAGTEGLMCLRGIFIARNLGTLSGSIWAKL